MIGNDFVMMALFIAMPIIGLAALALMVKQDEADHISKTTSLDSAVELSIEDEAEDQTI